MPCSWEGNRRLGVAQARHQTSVVYSPTGSRPGKGKKDKHPASTPHGVWHIACNTIKHCNITTKTKPKTLHATNLQDFSVAVLVKTATIKTAKRLWAVLSWCKYSFTCKGLKRGRGVHLLWMVKERSVDDMLPEEHSRSWSLDWALVTFFLFFSPIDSPHRFDPP